MRIMVRQSIYFRLSVLEESRILMHTVAYNTTVFLEYVSDCTKMLNDKVV